MSENVAVVIEDCKFINIRVYLFLCSRLNSVKNVLYS